MWRFAKNMEIREVLPKIWNYMKFCQKYKVMTYFCQIYGVMPNFAKNTKLCFFQKQFLFNSFNRTYMVSPISPI
jgi:hypothetical protein